MSNKSLKNFSTFLKENWSDKVEEFVDDITNEEEIDETDDVSDEESIEEPKIENEEEAEAESEEISAQEPMVTHEAPACGDNSCKVVFLSGVVGTVGKENANTQITTVLKEKLCGDNCKEVQLFQLNIQPASEGEEPMDGMVQVYEAIEEADAIIVCSDLKKGQISSVLQTTLERLSNHYKSKELRNKIFGSVINGQEDAHQNVKSALLNFANNMGMIVGGDCNVFCGEELGDIETETSNASVCIKELCCATASIRGSVVEHPTPSVDYKPTAISTILNFDDFEDKGDEISDEVSDEADVEQAEDDTDLGYDDDGEEEEDDDTETETEDNKIASFDEFDGEEEDFEDEAANEESEDDKKVEEEEEGYYYDYNNNIAYNRTETPMTKPNPVKLTKESKGCGKKGCSNCKCKKVNESKKSISLLNFDKFMDKRNRK